MRNVCPSSKRGGGCQTILLPSFQYTQQINQPKSTQPLKQQQSLLSIPPPMSPLWSSSHLSFTWPGQPFPILSSHPGLLRRPSWQKALQKGNSLSFSSTAANLFARTLFPFSCEPGRAHIVLAPLPSSFAGWKTRRMRISEPGRLGAWVGTGCCNLQASVGHHLKHGNSPVLHLGSLIFRLL